MRKSVGSVVKKIIPAFLKEMKEGKQKFFFFSFEGGGGECDFDTNF